MACFEYVPVVLKVFLRGHVYLVHFQMKSATLARINIFTDWHTAKGYLKFTKKIFSAKLLHISKSHLWYPVERFGPTNNTKYVVVISYIPKTYA